MPIQETSPQQQHRFLQETLSFIRRRGVFNAGDRVLLAASGGLDSTILVHVMARVARLLQIEVAVAHVDHGTRGEASEREGIWVKVLAERLHLEAFSLGVAGSANSSQDELRSLRIEALENLARKQGFTSIATAHHADDNAETFLMRAISGTGQFGLAGIRPAEGKYRRPLLWATRVDLETYAREHRLAWVEDPSNARTEYLRNKVRINVLPEMEKARQGAIRNLARAAERLEEEESAWDTWLAGQMEGPKDTLSQAWLERWPQPMRRRVLRFWLKRLEVSPTPQLLDALLKGEELIHPAGSFIRRADMLVFNREHDFGSLWQDPMAVDVGKRISLNPSMAWSFLPSAPLKQSQIALNMMMSFKSPSQRSPAGTLRLAWDRLPWPLALRSSSSAAELVQVQGVLKSYGIPKPYWKAWPLLVSQDRPDIVVGVVGLKVFDGFEAKGGERCVSIEHFYEDSLNRSYE
jgi:tRNA(Ile)-lysidine synthetase-like protein